MSILREREGLNERNIGSEDRWAAEIENDSETKSISRPFYISNKYIFNLYHIQYEHYSAFRAFYGNRTHRLHVYFNIIFYRLKSHVVQINKFFDQVK